MGKIIVITSGKGGVGKTTSAVNLGAAINYFKRESLVIDGNFTTPNVGLHMGSPEVPVNLNHVISGKAEPFEAIYEHESGLKIAPSSLSIKELKNTNPEKLKKFRKHFKRMADFIIVDSAAGLGREATSIMDFADEIILITNPEIPAIADALKTIKVAEKMRKPIRGVIITKVRKDDIEMQPETVKEMLEVPILGMVPHDMDVKRALNSKGTVVHIHPKSKPARAYKEIAARILGVNYDSQKEAEGILERIFKKLRLKNRKS